MPAPTKLSLFVIAFAAALARARDEARARRDDASQHGWRGDTDRYDTQASVYTTIIDALEEAAKEV
jgi:hypothetical protein